MATRTISAAGGNWNATTSWDEAAVPVAGDAVVARGGGDSGQLTMNASGACASIDLTNYANTLTLASGGTTLTVSGSVTLGSSMTVSGTVTTLICNATGTLTSNGKTWTGKLTLTGGAGPVTFTLADNWTVNGLVTFVSSPVINGNTLNCGGGLSGSAGTGNSGTTLIKLTGTGTLTGSTGTFMNSMTFDAGAGTITVAGTNLFYSTGTLTYTSGTVIPGTTVLNFPGSATVATAGVTWGTVTMTGAQTLTINSTFSASSLTIPNANVVFAGSAGFDVGTLAQPVTWAGTREMKLQSSVEYKVSSALNLSKATTASYILTVPASTPGTKALFTLGPGATQDVAWVSPTDIDSTRGQTIFTYKGTVTTSYNWSSTLPLVQRHPQVMLGG